MPEAPKKLRVFLCHSAHDKPVVRDVYQQLSALRWIDPWLDEKKLLPGQDWTMEIEKAVEASHIVLVFLTRNSINKEGYIQRELRQVLEVALNIPEDTIFVIPLRLEDCELPRRLRSWQWLDYFPAEQRPEAFERLLASLKVRAMKLGMEDSPYLMVRLAESNPESSNEPDWITATAGLDPDLDLHIPPEYAGATIAPAPAKEKTEANIQAVESKSLTSKFSSRLIGGLVGSLLVISLTIWGLVNIGNSPPPVVPEPTQTLSSTSARPSPPARTGTPSLTPTITPVPPTPTLGIGSTLVSDKDAMTLLLVPAGNFMMGSSEGDSDEKPVHTVNLDAFWIDQTEVTNRMYSLCVAEGVCRKPADEKSKARSSYYGVVGFDNYPVIHMDWEMANTYCKWANRRLPTEAEWEKAARGDDGRIYPWGNNQPNNDLLNYKNLVEDTAEVGRYPDGASPYGALDMSGNVWEWVADWYDENYYGKSPTFNPPGPVSGASRVLRGGSWNSIDSYVRSSKRVRYAPLTENYLFGFRCAMSASE